MARLLKSESPNLGKAPREVTTQSMLSFARATCRDTLRSNQEPLMSRDIVNLSDQETLSISNCSHNLENRPQHVANALEQDSVSLSCVCRNAKDRCRKVDHSNQQTLATFNSCSPQAKCQFCDFVENSYMESRSVSYSAHRSTSARTFVGDELQTCQSTSKGSQCQLSTICVDPGCSEIICEECSDHEECCEYCVEDCGSDCGVSIDCDGPGSRIYDDCAFAGSYSELFGDQAAETFGLGGCLPQLPMETTSVGSSSFGLSPDDANVPVLTGHELPGSSFYSSNGSDLFQVPMQFRTGIRMLEAAGTANIDEVTPIPLSSFGKDWDQSVGWKAGTAADGTVSTPTLSSQKLSNIERITAHASPAAPLPNSSSPSHSADPAQDNAAGILPPGSARVQDSNIDLQNTASNRSIPPPIRCQWADLNGKPCGRVFALGDDLHKHLQTVHGVKSEVFCRWLGCRVGILGATPHRYANSVQRHTWGHSGYRPYKCPICSEGFAAANVREEHFMNFHLRRKMFACDICTHQCTSATNLKRHKDEKHRADRFQCEFCNRNGKVRLFPRGPNLARHFRKCKYVLALFPGANGSAAGKIGDEWFPPSYRGGHHGMDGAKITPPNYLPVPNGQ